MRVENLQADTTITENGERVYSPHNKPSAHDVGAITQADGDARYLGKTAKATSAVRADTAGTADNANKVGGVALDAFYKKTRFKLGGDINSYYPISVSTAGVVPRKFRIYRTDVHEDSSWRGSLSLTVEAQASGYGHTSTKVNRINHLWNGNASGGDKPLAKFVGMQQRVYNIVIWLRGATNYNFESFEGCYIANANSGGTSVEGNDPITIADVVSGKTPTVSYVTLVDVTNGSNDPSGEYSYESAPLNVYGDITENGERVYSPNNKPTWDDVGGTAYASLDINTKYITTASDRWNMCGGADRGWMPSASGTGSSSKSYLGNSSWWFKEAWSNSFRGGSIIVTGILEGNSAKVDVFSKKGSSGTLITIPDAPIGNTQYINWNAGKNIMHFKRNTDGASGSEVNVYGTLKEIGQRVYSPNNKPSWNDIQGTPSVSWNNINTIPATASRWPTWNEVTGKPSTMAPSSHTHPWSQITGAPVYTQRWPSWSEVTSKPSDLLTKASADGYYLGKTAKAESAKTADAATYATTYLRGNYIGGGREKPNYFGGGKLRCQMLHSSNISPTWGDIWTDALWISSYSGSDVKQSTAIVTTKSGTPRIGMVKQNYDSTSWGSLVEFYTTSHKPTAADVGALTQATADGRYLAKTAKAASATIADTTNRLNSSGRLTAVSGSTVSPHSGLTMVEAYNNGYPESYGNVIKLKGASSSGEGELLVGWSGSSGSVSTLQYRSKRDVAGANWSAWSRVYDTNHKPTPADIGALGASSKAVDSAKLNGVSNSTLASANTIAQRDASSDVTGRLFRSTYQNDTYCSGAIAFRTNNGSDNYTRYCSSPTAVRDWVSDFVERVGFISSTGTPSWHKLFEFNASQIGAIVSFDIVGSSGYNQGANQLFRLFGSVHTGNGTPANGIDGSFVLNGTGDFANNGVQMRVVPTNNTHFVVYAYLPAYAGSGSYVLARTHKASGVSGLTAHSNSQSTPSGGITMKKQTPYTISSNGPSGGYDGDVWLQFE